ncbi:MAG: hypothetical protein ABS76_23850 [Pelagibacterium sp. SCN 64-44]|nr:MAG: hypothetical protein ABS76_23850 [Pelagibacterium sp. SCN 64-44]
MSAGLDIAGISVRAGGRTLLDRVDFTAARGAVTGLIGPNGAGKSTLMRAFLGLMPKVEGRVCFNGADLLAMPGRTRAQLAAFVEQSGGTDARLTARDVVLLGRIPFQSLWQSGPSPEDARIAGEALDAVTMGDFAGRLYHTLSGGEQQRVQIARALAQQPQLLVLDEPTNHLDIQAQLATLTLLRRLAAAGATVVVALHDLNLAAGFCDHLVVLNAARLAAAGPPGSVLTPALLRDIYQVEAVVLAHPQTGRPMLAYGPPTISAVPPQ